MQVVVAGSTGLVGRHAVELLLAEARVSRVTALVRRAWPDAPADPRLAVTLIDFDHPDRDPAALRGDALLCALGTTIKAAGSQEAFRRVDHDYPVALGRLAREAGARHYLLVSAMGADPASRFFYNRVKGETERDILALGFPSVTIARPSLLVGEREEFRLGEALGRLAGVLAPPRWSPVPAEQVAGALVDAVLRGAGGVEILENTRLRLEP
jgi:uncharacterized protein YbjT (DUF2867 family)